MNTSLNNEKGPLDSNQLLGLIFKYFSKISRERDLDTVLETLSNLGRDVVNADRCSLWLLDQEMGMITTKVAHGVKKLSMKAYYGLVGHCIKTGKELMINDPYSNPYFNKQIDKQTGFVTKSIIVIPIKNDEGEVIGAFQALNKKSFPNRFSREDVERLRMVASYSGKSIENARLHTEMEETQKEIITLLAEAGECRSIETGNHVKRVVQYSKVVAESLGLSKENIDLLQLASPMHDIGKVGIPDAILQKPGKFTPEEYEVMKKHSEIGYNLLKKSKRPIVHAAAIIALQHHERYDGKGYPQGLAGEDIHVFARITSVCDVFDALASKRVYKDPWELDKIYELMQEERGKQFDPKIVDALLERWDEIVEIHFQLSD